MAGKAGYVQWSMDQMQAKCTISKAIADEEIVFNGCKLTRNASGDIKMSMKDYVSSLKPFHLEPHHREEIGSAAIKEEISKFTSLAAGLHGSDTA